VNARRLAHVVPLTVAVSAAASTWPGFLPSRATYTPKEVSTIERAWTAPTVHRTVEGPPAPLPLASYLLLIDAPEFTAAAARQLGLARYEVHEIAPDWYAADDHGGSRGIYRMLVRHDGRRVTLSWGTRTGPLIGTVSGSALTVLEFSADGDRTRQRIETYVVIDNAVAAGVARALVAVFGRVADRLLTQGFTVTAKVAAWARDHPDEFCAWAAAHPADLARDHADAGAPRLCRDRHPVTSEAR
jgi:hypothetical protein